MADRNEENALAHRSQDQAGTFTRAQALASGFTRREIRHRLDRGIWVPIHPGVYRPALVRETAQARAIAALLYCGEGAMFSHITAARMYGLDLHLATESIWITIPHARRIARRPGIRVVRSRNMPAPTRLAAEPVTPLGLTVVDLAGHVSGEVLARAVNEVMRARPLVRHQISGVLEDLPNRPGVSAVRRLIDEWDPASESDLEDKANDHLRGAGIALARQVEVWDGPTLVARCDFADEELRLDVEVDGWAYHSSPEALTHDRMRDRAMDRLGWSVARFSAEDIYRSPETMVRHVRHKREELRLIARTPA